MRKNKLDATVKALLDRRKKKITQSFIDKWIPLILTDSNIIDPKMPALFIPQGKDRFIFTKAGYKALEANYLKAYPDSIRCCLGQKLNDIKGRRKRKHKGKDSLNHMFDIIEEAEAAFFKENPEALADAIAYEKEVWKAAYERTAKDVGNSVIELAPFKMAVRECLKKRNKRVVDAIKEAHKHPMPEQPPENFKRGPLLHPKVSTPEEIIQRRADLDEEEMKHIYLQPPALAESVEAEIRGMQPDYERGRKVIQGASDGGKARASKYDWKLIQREADIIWEKNHSLSKVQVAKTLKRNRTIDTPSISQMRQTIKKPSL